MLIFPTEILSIIITFVNVLFFYLYAFKSHITDYYIQFLKHAHVIIIYQV